MSKQAVESGLSRPDEHDALKAQLAEIQAKKSALAKAKADREARDALRKQIEDEQLALANEEAIAQAEEELGEIDVKFAVVDSPAGVIIVRRPNPLKYKQFQDAGKFSSVALEKLVLPCRFYPEQAKFETLLEEYPGLLLRCGNAVTELANGRRKETDAKF